jgi:hypothetical protein
VIDSHSANFDDWHGRIPDVCLIAHVPQPDRNLPWAILPATPDVPWCLVVLDPPEGDDVPVKTFRRTLVDASQGHLFWEPTPLLYQLCFDEIDEEVWDKDREIPDWRDRQWMVFV